MINNCAFCEDQVDLIELREIDDLMIVLSIEDREYIVDNLNTINTHVERFNEENTHVPKELGYKILNTCKKCYNFASEGI